VASLDELLHRSDETAANVVTGRLPATATGLVEQTRRTVRSVPVPGLGGNAGRRSRKNRSIPAQAKRGSGAQASESSSRTCQLSITFST
jgi:hypothetical protein